MESKRIVLAGGSGFLGSLLARDLASRQCEVVVLTRTARDVQGSTRQVAWDGRTLGVWTTALDGAEALINLSGRSVDCRYHARNRRLILDSRVESTRVLGEAILRCEKPPRVWLNASTATIYRHSFDRPMDENGEIGATKEAKDAFSVEVAQAWERALDDSPTPGTRKVVLRTAMVLGSGKNSVLPVLRRLVRCGLGGSMAGGSQYASWIHEADFCRAVDFLLKRADLGGAVNLSSPQPVTNRELMGTLREVCGVPFGLPAMRWMLELGAIFLRTETELIVKSRRVVPGRLLAAGFEFRFPSLRQALEDLCGKYGRDGN